MGTYHYKLPDIGEGVVEAEITAWHVTLGQSVSEEDPIADAMTDKATIELTSPVDGVIKSIACEEGDILAVGAVLVELEVEGDGNASLSETQSAPPNPPEAQQVELEKPHPDPQPKDPAPADVKRSLNTGKVLASPAVRKRAAALKVDLSQVPSTDKMISHADLDAYLVSNIANRTPGASLIPPSKRFGQASSLPPKSETAPLLPDETRIKVIGLRRTIATRMQEAKRNIPHFTYVDEIDVTALEALRARMNENRSEDKPKLTVLPLMIRALAVTLEDWPQFNARYYDKEGYVSQFKALNLGLATQTEGGLIVPVIKQANHLSVWALATEIGRLSEAARTNKLDRSDLEGATTTLTSLGPLGGIITTPVINRPEVAIFGPNKIREILKLEHGEIVPRKVMNVSISCDHRVIDGYDAAAMIQDLKARLEDPRSIFLL